MKSLHGVAALVLGVAFACPDHSNVQKRASSEADYSYYKAQDWGHLKEGIEGLFVVGAKQKLTRNHRLRALPDRNDADSNPSESRRWLC